ncbi:MAG: chondroitinase-B domain-containing protein [Saprospiraceae bacterium]
MRILLPLIALALLLAGCNNADTQIGLFATNSAELHEAIKNAKPGDNITLANGTWKDVEIRFNANGTEGNPITLQAEEAGKVSIEGKSDLKIGGSHLVVSGLHFKNGSSPSRAVIQFKINQDTLAFNCQVTNCVIDSYNQSQRNKTDLWVLIHGRNNSVDHCYFAGKSNRGPTLRVDLEGNESIKNYHNISNNHFGPRPPKGGPSAETIQIGNSYTSMAPSYTYVADNFFEYCNGEVEIISSKTNFNEFRNNVFYKSEGSLVTRHGNYCIVDGNYFIGDEASENVGGVRLIGSGHWVTNNYFYNLKGENFRSPLAVMNGIRKSPLNRYIQVTDVVVANNSWINCTAPLQFGVGSNIDQRDVLPASEIRSERPIRTIVANNLIHNEQGDPSPIVAHDKLDGINFQSNYINNQGVKFEGVDGLYTSDFSLNKLTENIWTPAGNLPDTSIYQGFEFDQIATDILGAPRADNNAVGAITGIPTVDPQILDHSNYGASWFTPATPNATPETHKVSATGDLSSAIAKALPGDVIEVAAGNYSLTSSLIIDKPLTIRSADASNKATINYTGAATTPAFEMNPQGQLTLSGVALTGTGTQYAFASLKEDMSSLYNLTLDNCEVSNFNYILKAYKYSFSENIRFTSSTFRDCENGIELSEEIEDKGDYNAENITIADCSFDGIQKNVIDYYRGGYDESTVGGTLTVSNSTFTNSGAGEKSKVLLNTYGIINVHLTGNTFKNNNVKLVALLWGAKNNTHSNNNFSNSGEIRVEENLKLNLLY